MSADGAGEGAAATEQARVDVLGVAIDAIGTRHAIELCRAAIAARRPGYVCFCNVHNVTESQGDDRLRAALAGASLALPDGMPIVWFCRARGVADAERVAGPEFMIACCRALVADGARHYLYGGAPGVAAALAVSLARLAPGVRVVGTFTPPFRDLDVDEERALAEDLARTRPDVMWIGIGSPRQEIFCAQHAGKLNATLLLGVGAAFDFHTGRLRDAPPWMKRAGLQWLHRLAQDPRRLAGRYLRTNPRFVLRAASALFGRQGR